MVHTRRKLIDRVMAVISSFLMVIAMFPVNVHAVGSTEPSGDPGYATVTAITGGTVEGSGTADVKVTVTETELTWSPIDTSIGRYAEGWWAGIDVTAPDGFDAENAVYQRKDSEAGEFSANKLFDDYKDADGYIGMWQVLTPESIVKAKQSGQNFTKWYRFDWNADGEFEQNIEFTVIPSDSIRLRASDGSDSYAFPKNVTLTVTNSTGHGKVLLNEAETATAEIPQQQATLKVVADEGYVISSLKKNGVDVIDAANKSSYDFGSLTVLENTSIDVSFVKVWTVTVTSGANGTVTVTPDLTDGSVVVTQDQTVTITAVPNANQRVNSVTLNGNPVEGFVPVNGQGFSATFTASEDRTYAITFGPDMYNVTVNADQEGIISTATTVAYDETVKVYVNSEEYTASSIQITRGTEAPVVLTAADFHTDENGTYFEITNVVTDITIDAVFVSIPEVAEDKVTVTAVDLRGDLAGRYVVNKDGNVTVSTACDALRVYTDGSTTPVVSEDPKKVVINTASSVTKMEVLTREDGELYATWHTVDIAAFDVTVDQTAPVIALSVPAANSNGYYNSDVTIPVTVTDQELTSGKSDYAGLSEVKYSVYVGTPDGDTALFTEETTQIDDTFTGEITVDASVYNSDSVKVKVTATDRAGNVSTKEVTLKINSTAPAVSLDITGTEDVSASDSFFSTDRELTVQVTDRDDTFDKANATAGLQITKDGSPVTVTADDLTWTGDSGVHTATYSFTENGHYTVAMAYTNKADLSATVTDTAASENLHDFWIDHDTPTDLKITYSSDVSSLFGIFGKDKVKVTVEAKDAVSGMQNFIYSYTKDSGYPGSTTDGNEKTDVTVSAGSATDGVWSASFDIPSQFRGKVSFTAVDNAGNKATLTDDGKTVVVDSVAPGIEVTYDETNRVESSTYYTGSRHATVSFEEANFFAEDVISDDALYVDGNPGQILIRKTTVDNSGRTSIEAVAPETFINENDKWNAVVPFDGDGDYRLEIMYCDRSGNKAVSYDSGIFTIDTQMPVVSVSYDDETAKYENDNQFRTDRNALIKVTEHNFDPTGVELTVTRNGETVESYTADLHEMANWTASETEADVYTAEVTFKDDGHYTVDLSVKDAAKQSSETVDYGTSVSPTEFTVDHVAPTDLKVSYNSSVVGKLMDLFGFYGDTVTVTLEAKDETSGITGFKYSYQADTDNPSANTEGNEAEDNYVMASVDGDSNAYKATFDIPAQFRGKVSFTAVDDAGNRSDYVDGKTVVVDTIAPGITVSYDNDDVLNEKYYKAGRTATITIDEANFFAEDIVEDLNAYDSDAAGQLLVKKTVKVGNADPVVEAVNPGFTKNAAGNMEATISFEDDADYRLEIYYRDRSTNEAASYDSGEFTVDKTSPVVTMDLGKGAYYNADRTVKVKVVEHNFDPSVLNFSVEAKDTAGEVISLDSKGYPEYLQDITNWKKTAEDTYEAELTFDIEGNYTTDITYADPAGNQQTAEVTDSFCVDKTKPDGLKITYRQDLIGTLTEIVTFGFYKAPVTVIMDAYDAHAGVAEFRYQCPVQDKASSINDGFAGVIGALHEDNTFHYYAEFTIPAQYRGNVSFTAADNSGNTSSIEDAVVTVVDDIAPVVNVSYDNDEEYHTGFYQSERNAEIKIEEANFFPEADLRDGQLVIGVSKTLNDGTSSYEAVKPEFTKDQDLYTGYVGFSEDADYTFDISYTDRSGNVFDSYEMDVFTVDNIDPLIDVRFNDSEALYDNGNQFRTDRKAVITVTEHNFDAKEVNATVTAMGKKVESYTEYLKQDANWKHYTTAGKQVDKAEDGDVHVAEIIFKDEAHYTFDITCKDKAGRSNQSVNYGESVSPNTFTVDKSAPADLDIQIEGKSVLGSMETVSFDTFYDHTAVAKLSGDFTISGMQSMLYQKVTEAADYNVNGEWTEYNSETGIAVEPNEKFILYFRAQDRAGNVSIVRSTGIVVDDQKPIGEKNAPEIDILPAEPNEHGIHNGNVSVDMKVVDPKYSGSQASQNGHYSGLNKITYRILTTDTDAVETGTLLDINGVTEGAVFDKDQLISSWSGSITVDATKFNSNNVIVEVTATDNAGNTRTTQTVDGDIRIDITAPVIDVTYDNNSADSGEYFKDDRTATVVITERNFNPEDVNVTLTSTENAVPTLTPWQKVVADGNQDNTKWISTLHYSADGDYEFAVEYTDLAGWKCAQNQVNYGDSVAPQKFTIDHTVPTVTVSYDNNAAVNGNYYKQARTATVVIHEHNLDPNGVDKDRVVITMSATDDGAATTVPSVSEWRRDGDDHTAVIQYNADALYTFDIAITDKAGNTAAEFDEQTFYVDLTAPSLDITGVADRSANAGDVIPVVTYSDTNYDENQVSITLVGANRKEVALDGGYSDQHNGRVFVFNNFPVEKDIDDIYTLRAILSDKAGNTTEKTITFSVNRFGSTYALSQEAMKLNGSFVKTPTDVEIYETNVDELSNIKVTLFKDGTPKVLNEGSDYKISLEGGNGSWYYYTYTVFAKNFAEDGLYSLTVESDDAAGNSAKTDQDTKNVELNFGVDATLPIINVENLESNKTYAVDNMTVNMNVKDNLKLTKVVAELDGKTVKTWSSNELDEAIRNGGNFSFDIAGDSTDAHNLVIYAVDAAGNGQKMSETELPANAERIDNFYVTTNLWVRFYTNKPLFFGTIGGSILLIGLLIFLIL